MTISDQTSAGGTSTDKASTGEAAADAAPADVLRADVLCSFCLKATADVETMVAGPGVFICDACVRLCVVLIESKPKATPQLASWDRGLKDEDLLAMLPKIGAAGAQVERQLDGWVRRARARGITWTRVGAAMGMTRQSAWERFSGEE
jgi:hypothetical protein